MIPRLVTSILYLYFIENHRNKYTRARHVGDINVSSHKLKGDGCDWRDIVLAFQVSYVNCGSKVLIRWCVDYAIRYGSSMFKQIVVNTKKTIMIVYNWINPHKPQRGTKIINPNRIVRNFIEPM